MEAGTPRHEFSVIRCDGEMTLFHLSLVNSYAPKGEQFDMSIDVPLIKNLVPTVLVDVLLLSSPACKYEGKGEAESAARIALQRKEARKMELKPLRLLMQWCVAGGVGRAAKLSSVRQLAMSPAGGMVTWMEHRRAAWWLTMMGKAEGLFPMRHLTLSMRQRRALPKL